MGRGMRAGRPTQKDRTLKKIERFVREYEAEERKRLVDYARADLEKDIKDTLSYQHNVEMIAVMFALRDEFGFGKRRLIRAIKKTTEHAEEMLEARVDLDEALAILKDETGIREDELSWDIDIEIED